MKKNIFYVILSTVVLLTSFFLWAAVTEYRPETVEFFLVSPNIEVSNVKCYDLEFKNSDHNPVQARFRLRSTIL